jgi:hypothetical protein
VWNISRHFYVKPWSAGHFRVAGNRKIDVSGKSYQQLVFAPELSVKFGVVFCDASDKNPAAVRPE